MSKYLELVCPAGTPSALRAAVDAGADTVYCGFRDATNARNYPGLNFDPDELAEGVEYAHTRKCRVLVAVNTFPRAGDPGPWRRTRLRRHPSSEVAPPFVGASLSRQPACHPVLSRGVWHQPRGAAACSVDR
jgi:hypothetical protein